MRRVLLQIHLWLGLTVGMLWALQGLSGALLIFHREVDRITAPAASIGGTASLDAVLGSAKQATAGASIVRLSVTDHHRDRIDATYVDAVRGVRAVVIDAATARVLEKRDMEPRTPFTGAVTRWLLMFHSTLTSGRIGEVLIGVSGLLLASAALIGLRLVWPARGAWKHVYSYRRWRTTQQRLNGGHRALGLTAGFIILTIALTGASMVFEEELRDWMSRVVPHQLAYRSAPSQAPGAQVSTQSALDIAQRQLPAAQWVRVTLPKTAEPVYTIRFHQPGESRWMGRTTVVVDAVTGHIESVYDTLRAPPSNRVIDALLPLHNGESLGIGGRILMMLAGLSLPVLYVTGVWRWFLRARARRAAQPTAHWSS